MEEEKYVYFKTNVKFGVGLRLFPRDPNGVVLNNANPYVSIKDKDLKTFLMANKDAIARGLIKQVDEPSFDFVTENTITDEEAEEIVKNLFILKKRLPLITSEATLAKLYHAAKDQGRSKKTLEMIEDRLSDVSPITMQGISMGSYEDLANNGGE